MNSTLIDNRQIRVFISSTFQDMQDERDYLMKRTFPKLRRLASERDVTLTELDLRWGITEEEARSGKVVEICLREIENSIPFFIGIIGNRYGWVPGRKDIGANVTDRFPGVEGYLDRGLSVTEMEMQYGVLDRKDADLYAYFYIKEQETRSDSPEALNQLKDAVRRSSYPCSNYSSLEDLGQQVEQAFQALMDKLFPEKHLSEHEKRQQAHRAALHRLQEGHIRIEDNLRLIDDFLSGDEHTLVLTSERWGNRLGGLSATVADYIASGRYSEQYHLIYYFAGADSICDPDKALDYLIREGADTEEFVLEDGKIRFLPPKKPTLIILDGFDDFHEGEMAADMSNLLDYLICESDRLILTDHVCDYGEFSPRMGNFYDTHPGWDPLVQSIRNLTADERKQLIVSSLARYHKRLTDSQLERICANPLFADLHCLKSMLNELVRFGDYDRLDERIDYYLQPQTAEGFYTAVLFTYEDDFSSYGAHFVADILAAILWADPSVMPLTEKALAEALGLKPIQWSDFYSSFSEYLGIDDGRLVVRGGMLGAVMRQYHYVFFEENVLPKLRAYFGIEEPQAQPNADVESDEYEDWFEEFDAEEIAAAQAQGLPWQAAEEAMRSGRPQEAIDFYMQQIDNGLHGDYSQLNRRRCYEGLLSAYRALGCFEEVLYWAEMYVRYFWAEPEPHICFAEELDRSGRHAEAEHHRRLAERLPADPL